MKIQELTLPEKYESAIWWKQYLGYVIDLAFVTLLIYPFMDGYAGVAGNAMTIMITGFCQIHNLFGNAQVQIEAINHLLFACIYIVILIIMEIVTGGRSVGKFFLGLKVINANNGTSRPNIFQSIIRNILRLTPFFLFLCIGYRPRGFHNFIAKTAVIEVSNKIFKVDKLNISNLINNNLPTSKDINSLKDLYELKQNGAISEEEYETIKNKILKK